MDENVKICRLCLKIRENDVPYFPITNNNAVLHNLNLISFITIKNVELTEDLLICNLCDNKLKLLASFKENVISNESQIQCNQKNDANSFLEAVSKDFDKICRLCLKTTDDATQLQENWKDSTNLFTQCNILLNLNIPKPSKICSTCDTMLKTMWDFVTDCSETEKHIADLASKKENLSLKEILVEIATGKSISLETRNIGEDNNNFSQEQKGDEASSTNVVGVLNESPSNEADNADKVTDNVVPSIKTSEREEENDASKSNDTKEILLPEKGENELNNLSHQDPNADGKVASNSTKSSSEIILYTEPSCDVSPISNKTPKTYARLDQDTNTDGKVANTSTKSSSENILHTEPSCDVSPISNKIPKTYARLDTDGKVANTSTKSSSENILHAEPSCDVSPISNKTPKTYARLDQDTNTDGKVANTSTKSSSENILHTELSCDVSPISNKIPKTYARLDQDTNTDGKVANTSTKSSSENILYTEPSCDVSPISNKTPKSYARLDQDQKPDGKVAHNTTESSLENIPCKEPPCDVSPLSNKTPKTYARTRSKIPRNTQVIAPTLKLNILSDIHMPDQNAPSTSKLKENESIIDQIISDFSECSEYTSIDASPVRNVADITLDMTLGPGGVVQTDSGEFEKDNITQELIHLLEGTEEILETKIVEENSIGSSKQYKNTEELLRVLEDDDEDVTEVYDQIKDISGKDGQKQEEIKSPWTKKNQIVATNRPVVQTTLEAVPVQKGENKVQNLNNLKGKSINPVFKQSTLVKKGKITPNISNKSSGVQVAQKKHNLRQKTIIMSFREMLNMKPLKNKSPQVAENVTKEMPETNNTIEKVQVQEISLEGKKHAEESKLKPQDSGKKGLVKKMRKNAIDNQEKEAALKAGTSYKAQGKKKLVKASSDTLDVQRTGIISQIEDVSFEKIHIKEISLVDDNPSKNTGTQAKGTGKKAPIKRMHKIKIEPGNISEVIITNTLQEPTKAPETATEKDSVVDKKRGKRKTALENQKEGVPIKRIKKSPQKQVSEDSNELVANQQDLGSLSARKGRARACKETTKSKHIDTDNQTVTNGDDLENSGESDDENDECEAASQSSSKPVVVIIRRRKTKNKAQRDKTWSQLTGKPVGEGNEEVLVDEEDLPKKKRGRPPIPDADRKPKKPKPKYYTCDSCPFKTISQNIIIQHQYIHNVVNTAVLYKCNQCGFKTPTEQLLEEHKVTHLTSETIYKCMFCEFSHKKKNSTMYHTLRHEDKDIANMFYCLVLNQDTDEEQYECFQCDYQNTEEAVMPDHVMDHQVEKIKNSVMTKFSCKKCSYKTKFEDTFRRHEEMHKEEKKGVKVIKKEIKKEPEPEVVLPEDSQVQDQDEEEVTEALTVYSCDLCCYHTYNKRSLANHKGLKHTRYAPPDANLEARRLKKRKPRPDEIYRCNECDYSTQKKPHLTRHMIIHRSKENMEYYECTYCIFETKHRRSYKRHMEVKHKVIV